nr:Sec-independent protein translocase subunit TatA [Streptacidiphilus melanogenes]
MLENRALEIIIIALVLLVLFGAKRLPDSARALGKSLRILKSETHAMRSDADEHEAATQPARPPVVPSLSTEQAAQSEPHPQTHLNK